jgi:prephenate dehydratase
MRAVGGAGHQAAVRCAYLGPRGTFCEQAMDALHPGGVAAPIPCPSIEAAFDAVRTGLADRAVVPIENSVEGGVNATMDELAAGLPLLIYAEILVPVEFALLARPGTKFADVKVVGGHPVAAPQCRRWLSEHVPDARWQPALSNAEAARQVADFEIDAALAGSFAARHYDLMVLAAGISDKANAVTRFVEVGPAGPPPTATGADRTCVIAFLADDHPGALMDILGQFAMRGVNLTRIESRPTGQGIGRYCFFIDCEGHVRAPSVGEALMGLRRACSDVRFLGSYARADGAGVAPDVAPGVAAADASFADAASWLGQIRGAGPQG